MQTVRDYAMSMLGLPYCWAGSDPIKGFDCSGLCIELLKSSGVLPRVFDTNAQGLYNKFLSNNLDQRGLGDLVFYGHSLKKISHVGFRLDDDRMIEAGSGNSKTINKEIAAKQDAFVRIRPIAHRKDLVAIVRPNYPRWLTF